MLRSALLVLAASFLATATACKGPRINPEPQAQTPGQSPAPAKSTTPSPAIGPVAPPAGPAAPAEPAPKKPASDAAMAESPDGVKMPILITVKQDSGLIIEDLKMGDGPDCMPNSVITVRYHGTLVNGEPFDTTRGKAAAEFPLDRLIRGWREGLPGMKVGGIRRLTVPAALAYGDRQKGIIPPNSDLIFSIELVAVK